MKLLLSLIYGYSSMRSLTENRDTLRLSKIRYLIKSSRSPPKNSYCSMCSSCLHRLPSYPLGLPAVGSLKSSVPSHTDLYCICYSILSLQLAIYRIVYHTHCHNVMMYSNIIHWAL